MKKAEKKRKILVDPVTGFHWLFQVGGTEHDSWLWYAKKFGLPLPEEQIKGNSGSFAYNDREPFTGLIWIRHPYAYSTLAHEIYHAVTYMSRRLDINPLITDEFGASYTGYLAGEFWRMMG